MELISWGAAIRSLRLPDKHGGLDEVVYGFDTLAEYEAQRFFFGAAIGRYGNRIAGGKFFLDGKEFTLARNDGKNHLHGGPSGFDRQVWKSSLSSAGDAAQVRFARLSPAGEEGYPGNLRVSVCYTLSDSGALTIDYSAKTDAATPFNPTNHAYWNLAGAGAPSALEQELELNCPFYLPVDEELIPTGEILSVKNTALDFTKAKKIGQDIDSVKPSGYDHCFVIAPGVAALRRAALLRDPLSGRSMEVLTTAPGIQVYSGNMITPAALSGGRQAVWRGAICLETEGFPDAVNRPHFPSVILRPGETFFSRTVHVFRN
jgi:aldose 1-epimerase